MKSGPIRILLVDDDEVDREALERAFLESRVPAAITIAHNAVEALQILRGSQDTTALPRPYLILLDLNMPRMDGLSFLALLRADPHLKASVVFVCTTSMSAADKAAAFRHNVAGYIHKSRVTDDSLVLAKMLDSYWRLVELPD